jgi:hypothetical protein
VCNLYPMTMNVDAICKLLDGRNNAGNLPSLPGIFPDYPAPVVRNADGERGQAANRPRPRPRAVVGARPIIRQVKPSWWSMWTSCLVCD